MADAACLGCGRIPCACGQPSETERAHALLAGIIGQRGETLDATVELVRAYIEDLQKQIGQPATAEEIRIRHQQLEAWWKTDSPAGRLRGGLRVDLAAYRMAVASLKEET